MDGGDEDPYIEPNVEEDFVVGIVPLDPLESLDETLEDLSVLKLALERRRISLKKGMSSIRDSGKQKHSQ